MTPGRMPKTSSQRSCDSCHREHSIRPMSLITCKTCGGRARFKKEIPRRQLTGRVGGNIDA